MRNVSSLSRAGKLFLSKQILGLCWLCLALLPALPGRAQTTEAYNWSNVAIGGGGFVSGLVMSHRTAGVMYARTDVGGAYRWDPANTRWIPLMDWASESEQGLLGVASLAIDPQNDNNIYALCGISYFNNGRSYVLRSTNAGASFSYVDITSQFKVNGNGGGRQSGEKLQVDPVNSATLYCGTQNNGLFKSTNSGSTWSRLTGLSVTTTPNGNGVSFVVMDKSSTASGATRRLFVGVSRSGSNQNFYKSEDGGATFTAITNGNLASGLEPQRAVLANGSLIITYGDGAGPGGGTAPEAYGSGQIWKYTIASGTWTNLTPAGVNHVFCGISVDPANANRLIASTTNNYQQQGTGGPYGDRFYLSTNGGGSWTDVVARGYTLDPNGITWVPGQSIHWAGCIEFDPFNTKKVLVTSGNGIYQNDDIDNSGTWKFQVKGLEETVPLNIVSIPGGPMLSVIGDYDGFRHTDVTAYAPIYNPRMGTTSGLDYAALNTDKVVRVGGSMYYSTDQGVSWTKTAVINGTKGQVALSANGATILHCPDNSSNTTTYRSTNNGGSWSAVSGLSFSNARPVSDRVNANKFYAYNPANGALLVSTNGGASFATAATLATGGSKVIRAIPGREGHLWVALYGGGLVRSTNSGSSFTKLSNVTTCEAVGYGLAASGASYQTIFIWGTVNGVLGLHRSTDQGASWVRVNDDKHEYGGPANGQFVMGDMNTYGRVYLSTAGRGIALGRTASASTPATNAATKTPQATTATLEAADALQAYPNPLAGSLTLRLPAALVGGTVSVVDALGRVVHTEPAAQADQTLNISRLPAGVYLVKAANGAQSSSTKIVKQ